MEALPQTTRQREIAQSIHEIDRKMYAEQDGNRFTVLEKQLADALEQMLRYTVAKPTRNK